MPSERKVVLRPLEREDLRFVHQMDNNANVMRYWFEEPYETFVELTTLYDEHIHCSPSGPAGQLELIA